MNFTVTAVDTCTCPVISSPYRWKQTHPLKQERSTSSYNKLQRSTQTSDVDKCQNADMAFYYSWPLPDSPPMVNKGRLITTITTLRDAFAAQPTDKTRGPVTKWYLLVSRAGCFPMHVHCLSTFRRNVRPWWRTPATSHYRFNVGKCLINLLPDRIHLKVVIKCDKPVVGVRIKLRPTFSGA